MNTARTEADLLAMLRDRYTQKAGNGDAWAFVTKVRDAAGFDAKRTIDALAMSLWPSRGLLLHGFEVKRDRRDWLRELHNPAKADAFGGLVDFFYLVVADEALVQDGELPEPWGLLVARGSRLVQVVEPKPLHDLTPAARNGTASLPAGLTRSFLAALLRSACRQGAALPEELVAAAERGRELERESSERELERLRTDLASHQERERRFRDLTGVALTDFGYRRPGEPDQLEQVGRAVHAALNGQTNVDRAVDRLKRIRDSAESLVADVDRALVPYLDGEAA